MAEQTLKPGWKVWRFDQIAINVNDRIDNPSEADVEHYVGLEHLDPDSLKIRRWGVPSDVEATKLRFRKGDIIFGRRRVYQRKLAVAEFDGICSAHAMVLRPKTDVVLPEFLSFFMQSDRFMNRALEISVGSLSPTINWKTLAAQEFALPPLEEQRRIVEVVRGSLEALYAVQGALESLKSLRFSGINTLCDHEEGCLVALGDVCEMQNGRAFPGDNYGKSGAARLLRPGNLGSGGYLDWSEEKTVFLPDKYIAEASDYVINYNDVVINLTAQSLEDGFMGRVCLARAGDHSLLNQRIGRFVFIPQAIHPQFAYRIMQTNRFQQHCVSMCEGTKVKHLYWRHLSPFQFRLPSLEKQQQVADALMELDIAHGRLLARGGKQKQLHSRILNSALVG
jgi:type I restriction enzyme S subunit